MSCNMENTVFNWQTGGDMQFHKLIHIWCKIIKKRPYKKDYEEQQHDKQGKWME